MYTVYALEDQRYAGDVSVRYIGITEDVYARFAQHLRGDENIQKTRWIQDLKDVNILLVMRTLEVVETLEEAREQEQYWIREYLSKGAHLFNQDIAKAFTFDDFLSFFGKSKPAPDPSATKKPRGSRKSKTVKEVAALIGCTDRHVRNLRSKGLLVPDEDDKNLITAGSVKTYIENRTRKVKVS